MNSMKLVILLFSLYWSIHTKDESKRGIAFAFIFGVNWLWRWGVTASFGVFFYEIKCNGMTSFMEFMPTSLSARAAAERGLRMVPLLSAPLFICYSGCFPTDCTSPASPTMKLRCFNPILYMCFEVIVGWKFERLSYFLRLMWSTLMS